MTHGRSPLTTLRGGLSPDVRPGRCAYCGRPCNGRTCAGHADLPELDEHLLLTSAIYRLRTLGAQHSPVHRSVETVDRPNGLRSDQGRALDRPEAQGIASTPVEQRR